jgi:LacI family transcriptional regulator
LPVVSFIKTYAEKGIGHVSVDATALARLAIEHFLERGFHHFAFCELDQTSHHRSNRMAEQLGARGLSCHVFRVEYKRRNDWIYGRDRRRLEGWIRRLPKPVGILAHNDVRGRHVADACRRLGLNVPEEVAVLGVDNELPHCEMCNPQLSSIITDAGRAGFEAASLLARMMDGDARGPMQVSVPPLGIVTRQSTDVTATSDQRVAKAARYIREHACNGIDVGDVLRHIVISRTALDNRFIACLGRTPHEEILRVRLKRAQELLAKTDFSIEAIAGRTGFRHGQYLGAVFRREFGQTPGEYRNHKKTASSPISAEASEQD